jgi:AraC-like DNA-binding protein
MRVLLVGRTTVARLGCVSAKAWSTGGDDERQLVIDDSAAYAELWRLVDDLRRPIAAAHDVPPLLACLARLLSEGSVPPPDHSPRPPLARCGVGVARVRDHLRAHVSESVSLEELATIAGLSKHYLLRAFRRAYGVTPHAFQMRLRLGLAWRMIVDGCSLTRATYDAGFADQSHLTRRFAAAFGLPPARYARLLAVSHGALPDAEHVGAALPEWAAAARSAA